MMYFKLIVIFYYVLMYSMTFFDLSNDVCQCPPMDKKIIETIKKRSDFICIGKATEELKTDSSFEIPMYRFKVDSVLKGQKKYKNIIINQNQAGNCSRFFKIGQEYYMIGNKVNRPKEIYSMTQKKHSKNLEEIINENYVITTDVCRSFSVKDNLVEYYFRD